MAKNISIALGDHFDGFIDEQVKSGRYGSAGEVICAGLHLLEQREGRIGALRHALIDGENSGEANAFSIRELKAKARLRHS